WVAGISAVGYVGTASSLFVALAVMVALLVLPAILSIAGNSIDRWRLPGLHAPAHESESGFGYRLSRVLQRVPLVWFVLTLAVLLVLALPALDMRLGSSDAGNSPQSFSSRRAYDLLARGFGPGFNGPILLGFSIDRGETEAVDQLPAALAKMENVALVSPASFNQDRTAAIIRVGPGAAPQEEETKDLVYDLREDLRGRFAGTGIEPYVGGPTALYVDLGQRIGSRRPLFLSRGVGVRFLFFISLLLCVVG